MAYLANFITGGTTFSSNDGPGSGKDLAVDGNIGTTWATASTEGPPQWWYYDLGSGVKKAARKVRIYQYYDANGGMLRDATVDASNNATDWITLYTIDDMPNSSGWNEYEFTNDSAYRYYRIYITANWRTVGLYCGFNEIEMMEFDIVATTNSLKNYRCHRLSFGTP